jgi:hypothetical protein
MMRWGRDIISYDPNTKLYTNTFNPAQHMSAALHYQSIFPDHALCEYHARSHKHTNIYCMDQRWRVSLLETLAQLRDEHKQQQVNQLTSQVAARTAELKGARAQLKSMQQEKLEQQAVTTVFKELSSAATQQNTQTFDSHMLHQQDNLQSQAMAAAVGCGSGGQHSRRHFRR